VAKPNKTVGDKTEKLIPKKSPAEVKTDPKKITCRNENL
jgi:hypothetical protein